MKFSIMCQVSKPSFLSVNCVSNNQVFQTQKNNLQWKSLCKFSKFTLISVFTSQD